MVRCPRRRGRTPLEVGTTTIGVACIPVLSYQDVTLSELSHYHNGCVPGQEGGISPRADCVAAMHRWCDAHGGGAGYALEVGNGRFGVACMAELSYNGVSNEEMGRYPTAGRRPFRCTVNTSQSQNCLTATHHYCQDHGGGAELSQEVSVSGFGVACMPVRIYEGSLDKLDARHSYQVKTLPEKKAV